MDQISKDILQRVAQFIERYHLLPSPSAGLEPPVYVGLSGGPDSVVLLHVLSRLGYRCTALHCNFRLRGDESERDEQFCRQLCLALNVPLEVRTFDTRAYMRQHHLSLEMAARQLRYQWWTETLPDGTRCFSPIALGHHQDDSIETLLMNLMRGTGLNGLTGIVPRNAATGVVRPLLCLTRSDIMEYLRQNDLAFVTDSTNAHCDTLRNQIRHQLLPLMEQLLPQSRQGIASTMKHLQASATFSDAALSSFVSRATVHHACWGLAWDELLFSPLSGALTEAFPHLPLESLLPTCLHHWEAQYFDPHTQRLERDNARLYSRPLSDTAFDTHRPQLTQRLLPCSDSPLALQTHEAPSIPEGTERALFEARFDASTVQLPLSLRRWQPADRIAPLGMNGHTKLVSDLFSNAHYSPMQKATSWLLLDATGAILWVIGLRMSDRHKVTPQTREVLQVICR